MRWLIFSLLVVCIAAAVCSCTRSRPAPASPADPASPMLGAENRLVLVGLASMVSDRAAGGPVTVFVDDELVFDGVVGSQDAPEDRTEIEVAMSLAGTPSIRVEVEGRTYEAIAPDEEGVIHVLRFGGRLGLRAQR